MSSRLFFVVELDVYLPSTATTTFTAGHGAKPHGALAEFAQVNASSETLRVSDRGYRYTSGGNAALGAFVLGQNTLGT